MALSDIYQKASLVQIPSGYKSGTLYNVLPNNAGQDFDLTRGSTSTRVNKDGLIENVVANVPRLNYDPSNPQDPHLLLEPERTNQFTNSENLANIDFQNNLTVTTDNIIAPNGSLTADKTTQTSGGYLRETVSVSNGTTYSFSVFLKKGDLRYAVVRSLFSQNGVTPANSNNVFDLDNGSVIYIGTDIVSASIEAYSNDWYRCSFVSLASGTSSASFIDFYFSSSSSSTQSSGTAGFGYGWGMQLEAGSYPTSYIPTTIAVTKVADSALNAGDSDIFNNTEGVLFGQISRLGTPATNEYWLISINDNSGQNVVAIGFNHISGNLYGRLKAANATQLENTSTSSTIGQSYKLAVRYSSTEAAFFIDGVKKQTISNPTAFTGTLSRLDFSFGGGSSPFYGKNYQLMYFDTALTDAELITLTT